MANRTDRINIPEARSLMIQYFLRGHIARTRRPGCDFGYCLVFTGNTIAARNFFQGLFGDGFYDRTVNLRDPRLNYQMLLGGTSVVNIAGGMADYRIQMSSITSRYIRSHCGKNILLPRQFVTCATKITPMMRPLITDPHFWVIGLDEDEKALPITGAERCQILAEAKAAYEAGQRYIPNEQEEALFQEQKLRILGMNK